ncbi:DUF805 domain-containing protein [Lactiplantibacillus nangangensis]|uniref:DUF805 domain-containing protein n=1 Tax=Lactiplantibacillus nangangensis TaxID=2559917 RepID=A0ABW1SLK7_9LACO|nr:DUF805 domain-containing protein [Lactiplantibacillus nangangensis]
MDKKFCIKCGKEIQESAEFCPFCGTKQENGAKSEQSTTVHTQMETIDKPYNESSNPNLISSTKLLFRDSFKIDKRMGRADYWWALLGVTLITFVITFVYSFIIGAITGIGSELLEFNIDGSPTGTTIALFVLLAIMLIYSIYIFIIGLTAEFRRLHDIGLSGAFWLINFVPVIGSLAVLIMMLQPSRQKGNRYINK